MARRFILTFALLVVTLALIASAAPVGATAPPPNYAWVSEPVATGACILSGQTISPVQSLSELTAVRITGNGFTAVSQPLGAKTCTDTFSINAIHFSTANGCLYEDCPDYNNYAFRITSATFHGGAHLLPGTQAYINFRVGLSPYGYNVHVKSDFSGAYTGDYTLTIPNTVSPQGNDWSSCKTASILTPTLTVNTTFSLATANPNIQQYDGQSTLTGDHNGKMTVDYTLEYQACTPALA